MANELIIGRRVARAASTNWLLPTLVFFFFLSGICGLVYQVLWLRLLALVFGVTIWAASTVLASFMAGLAIGSFAAGRFVDRVRNPLLCYGLAEVLIGLSALATPVALEAVERLYASWYPWLPPALGSLTAVRFGLAFAVLVVPTTLMGATLPIIVKSSLLRAEGLGERVSLLYATNTAGAIVGTLVAGFFLVGGVGVAASFRLAAGLNLLVGLAAVLASLALGRADAEGAGHSAAACSTDAVAAPADIAISARARWIVLLVFGLSGFTSLALEIIWFRVLVLFQEVTTYAFTVMLATFLAGIAAGSYLITPLMRRHLPWLGLLAGIEVAIGIISLLSLSALTRTYQVKAWVEAVLAIRGLPGDLPLMAVASFLAIFPATLLMGIAFPIGLRLWAADGTGDSARTGERIGVFYSLNVLGAILGSAIAGFLLLPWLGSQASLMAISALTLLGGLALLTAMPRRGRVGSEQWAVGSSPPRPRGRSEGNCPLYGRTAVRPYHCPLVLGAASVLLFLAATLAMRSPFTAVLDHRFPGQQLLWREEGVQTTVSVQQRPDGTKVLFLDGLHQTNDVPILVKYHRLIGHLPMVLHPSPRDALVVGLGGGATAGAVSQHPGATVDVVELAESVVHGSDWFRHVNNDVLRQPNVRLQVDDGRNYLLLTPKRYDVITADIIQPFHAGAGNLYSAEYYRLTRNALKDDGLMLQWIGVDLPETQYKLIMRTFLSVYPDATLWYRGSLLVGAKRPLLLDPVDLNRKWEDPALREELRSLDYANPASFLSIFWAGPEELHRYVGPGPVLTDDRPMVEYFLSLPRGEPPTSIGTVRSDVRRHIKQ